MTGDPEVVKKKKKVGGQKEKMFRETVAEIFPYFGGIISTHKSKSLADSQISRNLCLSLS